jgi:hypothetical protein
VNQRQVKRMACRAAARLIDRAVGAWDWESYALKGDDRLRFEESLMEIAEELDRRGGTHEPLRHQGG